MDDNALKERMVVLAAEAHFLLSSNSSMDAKQANDLRGGMLDCLIQAGKRNMEGQIVEILWRLSTELGRRMERDGSWGR